MNEHLVDFARRELPPILLLQPVAIGEAANGKFGVLAINSRVSQHAFTWELLSIKFRPDTPISFTVEYKKCVPLMKMEEILM